VEELRYLRHPARVRLEHRAVGLPEAQRVEVLDGVGAIDLEQEAARVRAIAAARSRLLDHRDRGAGVVRGDRGGSTGRAEPDHEDVDLGRRVHAGGSVIGR
jgi:hypothetical protein